MAFSKVRAHSDVARLLQEGMALHRAGKPDAAVATYRAALRRQSDHPDALHLLGLALWQSGQTSEGIGFIEKALAVRDDFPDAHMNAATIFVQKGDRDRAEYHVRRALHYRPSLASAHCMLGKLLRDKKQIPEAIAAFREALRTDPRHVETHLELARTFRLNGEVDQVVALTAAGLGIAPNHPTLHILAAEAQFARGQLADGWRNYRWRFEALEHRVPSKSYAPPRWDGSDLAGKTILIWTEQGPGDEIMHSSMFAEVIAKAGHCIIQCSVRLTPLLRRSFPEARVFDRDLTPEELTGIDFQCAAGDLGEWLRPSFASFPVHRGYLRPDPVLRDRLRAKYRSNGDKRILVGISWRSANAVNGADKSLSILEWGPILNVPGITFVNLQYGDCARELEAIAKGFGVHVVSDADVDPLRDMDAYAAQVAAMDFVVSSSNTAAHVAGALGIPTLCLLPRTPGRGRRWYWFAEREQCPWYPSMRFLSQQQDGEWLAVLRDAGLLLLDAAVAHGAAVAPPYLLSIAKGFATMGRSGDAEIVLRRLAREPGQAAAALHAIGGLRKAADNLDGALQAYEESIAADPAYWRSYNELGAILASRGRFEDAIVVYGKGLGHNPTAYELLNNLGTAHTQLGHSGEAVAAYERALAAYPADGAAATRIAIELNYSSVLDNGGRVDEAIAHLDAILANDPEHIGAHVNRSQLLLSTGRFSEGWREATWRLRRESANVRYDLFPYPRWNGEDLAGKNVLIWTEQGIGDEILVASMIPDALAAAKSVTVLCSERLVPLFRRSFPQAKIAERKEPLPDVARASDIDFQMSLSDLGAAFRPSFETFPKRPRFLVADPARRDALRRKYTSVRPRAPVVGLCWSSLKNYEIGWLKSVKLPMMAPVLSTPDVTFVSLQYGDRGAELAAIREQLGVEIINDPDVDGLKDMDGFAAQVAAVDLVISISNTTVHTAGALGVPVWVMLAEGRGRVWYWFRDRDDCPWYPSARFFRQQQAGDWDTVVCRVAAALQHWTATRQQDRQT